MTNFFKLLNRYWPVVTGIALLCGYLIYAVGFWLSKGIDLGFGISSQLESDRELMLFGAIFTVALLFEILFDSLWILLTSWWVYVSFAIGVSLGAILVKLRSDKAWKFVDTIDKRNRITACIVFPLYLFFALPEGAKKKGIEYAQNKIAHVHETNCQSHNDLNWSDCIEVHFELDSQQHYLKGLLLDKQGAELTIYLPGVKKTKTVTLPSNAVISRRYQAQETI